MRLSEPSRLSCGVEPEQQQQPTFVKGSTKTHMHMGLLALLHHHSRPQTGGG